LRAAGAEVVLRPESVDLRPGERRQVRLVATARGLDAPGAVPAELVGEVRARGDLVARQVQAVSLVIPEGP